MRRARSNRVYALVCLVANADDARFHLSHGVMLEISVPEREVQRCDARRVGSRDRPLSR